MKPPTAVPVRCPECGLRIALPVASCLTVGNVATVRLDSALLDEHMVVHQAEKILEGA